MAGCQAEDQHQDGGGLDILNKGVRRRNQEHGEGRGEVSTRKEGGGEGGC